MKIKKNLKLNFLKKINKNKSGFSLIQLVFVVAIMALLLSIAVPNFRNSLRRQERKSVLTNLNSIMSEVWLRALKTGLIHKILFDFETRTVSVSAKTDQVDRQQQALFEPVRLFYAPNNYQWKKSIEIQQFFIQGVDELVTRGIANTQTAYFFVMPDGMSQDIIITMLDYNDKSQDKQQDFGDSFGRRSGREFSLVLNPFTVQFREHE